VWPAACQSVCGFGVLLLVTCLSCAVCARVQILRGELHPEDTTPFATVTPPHPPLSLRLGRRGACSEVHCIIGAALLVHGTKGAALPAPLPSCSFLPCVFVRVFVRAQVGERVGNVGGWVCAECGRGQS